MKILHVIPSVGPLRGGPSAMVRQLATNLAHAGVDVHVAATNDNARGLLDVPLGQPVEEAGATYWYFARQSRFYTASWPLATWLATHVADFDLVHIHALFSFASLPAAYWAAQRRVPYIVRPLGTLNEWGMTNRRPWLKRASFRLLESRVVKHAALMHYTSEDERREANALTHGAASIVIPNPVSIETAAERRGAFRTRLGIASDAPLVLFLSRVDQKKGLDLLIQGFARLRAKVPNAVLAIAGNGEPAFVRSLRALAATTGLPDDAIVWAGFVDGEAKQEAFADADVFALPSYSENFGIAVAEAMAAGLPVVVSDRVGIHDDVVAAGAGYVVSCQASEIADALSALLANREMARVMGLQGANLVRRRYSDEAVTAQVMAAYRHVLDSATPSALSQSRLGAIQGHA